MEVRHDDSALERAEREEGYNAGLGQPILSAYRRLMNLLRRIQHEGELYQAKSRHFEKLHGKRKHQHSLRLNEKWRLIIEIEPGDSGNCLVVKGIEDYH